MEKLQRNEQAASKAEQSPALLSRSSQEAGPQTAGIQPLDGLLAKAANGTAPTAATIALQRMRGDSRTRLLVHLQQNQGNLSVQRLVSEAGNGNREAEGSPTSRTAYGRQTPSAVRPLPLPKAAGMPLDGKVRRQMETAFGRNLEGVRIHDSTEAAAAARDLNAEAFALGQNVYFGAGRYQPESKEGRNLLVHELTHTVQQGSVPSSDVRNEARLFSLSQPGDSLEQEARLAADRVAAGQSIPPNSISQPGAGLQGRVARQAMGDAAAPPKPEEPELKPPEEEVSLMGAGTFSPPPAWAAYLEAKGKEGARVPVRFGTLAHGVIPIRKESEGYATPGKGPSAIPLSHPALQPVRQAGIEPVLALRIEKDVVSGYLSLASEKGGAGKPKALLEWIKDHPQEMGWLGMDVSSFPAATNELKDGVLRLRVEGFEFTLGGFLHGSGDFGLENQQVVFDAVATVRVKGLSSEAELEIRRDAEGQISGQAEVPVSLDKFSGNLLAKLNAGTVDIRGTAGYTDEKFSGSVTLLVTDAATARDVAFQNLGPEAVNAAGEQAAGPKAKAPSGKERALAGWGDLDFAFTDWLTGKAQVIVDGEGHITVIGEITPQAEVELFPQKDTVVSLFKVEVRAGYGVPLVGNIFIFANIGMDALAKLGPGKLYNIAVSGRYSTDPRIFNEFQVKATLNISAFAGLRLRAEGGAGLELLGHDIKAGVGVEGLAGVHGYVEATPNIGYRESASPEAGKQGEFYIKGHMELAAQPFLGLSGDLFVDLDSPWWSPAPDKKWTWPLGQLEYPLPGEFGLGADVDYVIGSNELPEIQFGEVDFNKDKFLTDLLNDHTSTKSKGEQEKQGTWQEGETTEEGSEAKQVDTQGAPPDQPAQGRQDAAETKQEISPANQKRWLEGRKALGEIAQDSQSDPLTRKALDGKLAQIKDQYGFKQINVEQSGEDWIVHATMSPGPEKGVKIEGQAEEGAKPKETRKAEDSKVPTGEQGDPIDMAWYKPAGRYPRLRLETAGGDVEIGFGARPTTYIVDTERLTGEGSRILKNDYMNDDEVQVGLRGDNVPAKNKTVWQRVSPEEKRGGRAQKAFRALMVNLEKNKMKGQDADHVKDLMFDGDDDFSNLWPLDSGINQSNNKFRAQRVTYLDDQGEAQQVSLGNKALMKKYFKIAGFKIF